MDDFLCVILLWLKEHGNWYPLPYIELAFSKFLEEGTYTEVWKRKMKMKIKEERMGDFITMIHK